MPIEDFICVKCKDLCDVEEFAYYDEKGEEVCVRCLEGEAEEDFRRLNS